MSLAMRMETVGSYPVGSAGLAHIFGRELAAPSTSHGTPIVFVVHDDAIMRKWLELLICREGWVPETFASAQEFLRRSPAVVPNCLVVAVSLPDLNGLDLQKRVATERPDMPVIFVTDEGDVPTTVQAMKAGAVEFFTKPLCEDALVSSIREALKRSCVTLGHQAEMRVLRDYYTSLSRREREVMALVVSGLLNKQVGAELGISEITVKSHRGQVMQKMKANSLPDLVRKSERLRQGSAPVAYQIGPPISHAAHFNS